VLAQRENQKSPMQLRLASLALLLAGASAVHTVRRLGASEARAEAWMRDNPDAEGMNDLKNSDPNAYAIVSALLLKQQAGLLDPANPTGKRPEAEHTSAADIMRDAPSIEGAQSSMSEISIKAPVQHAVFTHGDPWAFKPHDDDEAMVSNVLGAASELTGSAMPSAPSVPSMPSSSLLSSRSSASASTHRDPWAFKPHNDEAMVSSVLGMASQLTGSSMPSAPSMPAAPYHPQESLISSPQTAGASPSALNADMDLVAMAGGASDLGAPAQSRAGQYYGISMNWGKKQAAPDASMAQQNSYVAPAQPAPPAMNRANPYLEGIDFGNQPAPMAPQPAVSMAAQGSYLESINFPGTAAKPAAAKPAQASGLSSFSWGEYAGVASGAVKVAPVQTQYMQVVEDKFEQSKLKGPLTDWLSPESPKPKPHRRQQQEQQDEEQPGDKVDPMAIDNYNSWAHSGVFQ